MSISILLLNVLTFVIVLPPVFGRHDKTRTLFEHEFDFGDVGNITVSSNGNLFAGSFAGRNRVVKIWDAKNGKLLKTLDKFKDNIAALSFCNGGKTLATVGGRDELTFWDTKTWKVTKKLPVTSGFLHFSFDQKYFATVDRSNVYVFKWPPKKLYRSYWDKLNRVRSVDFSRDGTKVAASDGEGKVYIWRLRDGKKLGMLSLGRNKANVVAFSPDGKTLLVGSVGRFPKNPLLFLVDAATGKIQRKESLGWDKLAWVDSMDFSPDGKLLAISGGDNKVWVFAWPSLKVVESLHGFLCQFHVARFYSDSRTIAAANNNRGLYAWRLGDKVLRKLQKAGKEKQK